MSKKPLEKGEFEESDAHRSLTKSESTILIDNEEGRREHSWHITQRLLDTLDEDKV